MNTTKIIQDWLGSHGYDGLCDTQAECGCSLESGLCPCSLVNETCEAGHNDPEKAAAHQVDWYIVPGKR